MNQHFQCGNANQEWNFFEVSQMITWRKEFLLGLKEEEEESTRICLSLTYLITTWRCCFFFVVIGFFVLIVI